MLGAVVLVVLAGLALWSNRVRSLTLLFPSAVGFEEVAPAVWVEREMSLADRTRFIEVVAAARASTRSFYEGEIGRPIVMSCASRSCFWRSGGIGKATALLGNRVLLSPSGVDEVLVAHELSHVVLADRVGMLRALIEVPNWFDEGLAVIASGDQRYGEERWVAAVAAAAKPPTLGELESLRGWLAATKMNPQLSYGTARHEVARWYARVGRVGLNRLFSELRAGKHFRSAYTSVELRGG